MKLAADSRIYLVTTASRCSALLALTIAVAYVNLGPLNTVVAMSISLAKALLIILFFMHVRGSSRPILWISAARGFSGSASCSCSR